jgi:hypothetical protein
MIGVYMVRLGKRQGRVVLSSTSLPEERDPAPAVGDGNRPAVQVQKIFLAALGSRSLE